MKKNIKQIVLDYLKDEFKTIENVIDVNNNYYNADPYFIENKCEQ